MAQCHYEVLGVTSSASDGEIKRAYRTLALRHHPDKGGNPEEFRKVSEAYSVIGDADARRNYDSARQGNAFGAGFDGGGTGVRHSRSSQHQHQRHFHHHPFSQHDAFNIFEHFFAHFEEDMMGLGVGMDHIRNHTAAVAGHGRSHAAAVAGHHRGHASAAATARDPFEQMMGGANFGRMNGMMQMMNGMGGMGGMGFNDDAFGGGGEMMQSFSSSSSSSSSGGQSISVSTRSIVDAQGKKTTVKETTTVGPDGQRNTTREEFSEQVSGNRGSHRRLL